MGFCWYTNTKCSSGKGFGCELVRPLSSECINFFGYAFVDDTNIIQSALQDNPISAMQQLQQAIDSWEFSLKSPCGALVSEKTVWWLVSFQWSGTTWRYSGIQDCPGELTVNNIANQRKTIKRLEPNQAYETLGVFLAPDGNLKDHYNKMHTAASRWADALQTGNISKDDVWTALQSTIWRTLCYPLPALCLSKAQCDTIMAPILQYCLPAPGVCRNFSRKLVFAPLEYWGLGFLHLFTLQEGARLKDIIIHTFNDTLNGRLYKTSLELLLIELGMGHEWGGGIDQSDIHNLTTPSLIKASVIFTNSYNITIKHDIKMIPGRENNTLIMPMIVALDISCEDLKACNHCRIYLQAHFLSDLKTGDGKAISDDAWNGNKSLQGKKDKSWPVYSKPPRNSWRIWQLCL